MKTLLRALALTAATANSPASAFCSGDYDYVVPSDTPPTEIDGESLCVEGGVLTEPITASNGSRVTLGGSIAAEPIRLSDSDLRIQLGYAEFVGIRGDSDAQLASGNINYISASGQGHLSLHGNLVRRLGTSQDVNVVVDGGSIGFFSAASTGQSRVEGSIIHQLYKSGTGQASLIGGYVRQIALEEGAVAIRASVDVLVGHASSKSTAALFGGTINQYARLSRGNSFVVLGGAIHGDLIVQAGATMTVSGQDFALDGQPIEGLIPGVARVINERNATFTSTLLDDTPFERELAGAIDPAAELRVVLGKEGDFNGDGRVNAADYTLWTDNLNGDFQAADIEGWRRNYGLIRPWSTGDFSTTVPEPSAALLLLATTGCLSVSRRPG